MQPLQVLGVQDGSSFCDVPIGRWSNQWPKVSFDLRNYLYVFAAFYSPYFTIITVRGLKQWSTDPGN